MSNLSLRQKIIGVIVGIGILLIAIFSRGLSAPSPTPVQRSESNNKASTKIEVVSTNPSPLKDAVVSPTQVIEISFNKPLANDPAKLEMIPKIKYSAQLSADHKTLKIIPEKQYELGQSYSLTIKSGYSFDNGEKLDHDEVFNFQTIKYSGV